MSTKILYGKYTSKLIADIVETLKTGSQGDSYEVSIKKLSPLISNKQRRYFFGVIAKSVLDAMIQEGWDIELDHVVLFLKDNFLFRMVYDPIGDEMIKQHISLSKKSDALTREEFNEAKERIQAWAVEYLNLELPDPDPNWKFEK